MTKTIPDSMGNCTTAMQASDASITDTKTARTEIKLRLKTAI